MVFYCHNFPRYRRRSHGEWNSGQFFRVTAFLPLNSPSKQTTLALALFFYHAYFLNYRNHQDSHPGQLCCCCGICSCSLLAEVNSFDLGTVCLLCLVSELYKSSSLELEHGTVFQGSGLDNLVFETNNLVLALFSVMHSF